MLVAVMLLPTAMQAQKWTNLFDGKTFTGWKQLNGQAKYEIKNGVIIGTTVANTPNSFMAPPNCPEIFTAINPPNKAQTNQGNRALVSWRILSSASTS